MARHLPRELDDGSLLRSMRAADRDELAEFVARVFGLESGELDLTAGVWARDLLRGDHPTSSPEDGTVVVDRASGRIVSCCFLISQTWTYAGIPFGVGRPELIATEPAYRDRGLVRVQFEAIHARSAALGQVMQALTGIPIFYRQFGYETALVTEGSRAGSVESVPELHPGQLEHVRIRPAVEEDLPFITRMYAQAADRAAIAAVRDEAIWRDELLRRNPESDYWHELRIVESGAERAGFLAFARQLRGETLNCTVCELTEKVSWDEAAPSILRALRDAGSARVAETSERFRRISLDWTPGHPLIRAAESFFDRPDGMFAWYVRIADVPGFVGHIAPVLERRLAASSLAEYSGELLFTFYPRGMRLRFEIGRLIGVESVERVSHREAQARFPGRTFLQLLLGARSLAELEHAFPGEAGVRGETARALVEVLFPNEASAVWPVA